MFVASSGSAQTESEEKVIFTMCENPEIHISHQCNVGLSILVSKKVNSFNFHVGRDLSFQQGHQLVSEWGDFDRTWV